MLRVYYKSLTKLTQAFGKRTVNGLYSSDANANILIVKYEEIIDLKNHPEKTLIDVREPEELKETGIIPCSINIPLGSVVDELKQNNEAFAKKYNRNKPTFDSEVIFSCQSGRRSEIAAISATEIGFTNVKNYLGSWKEYADRLNLQSNK